jgi:aliphatic sulfonates family ABC transporter substrate-binding protein
MSSPPDPLPELRRQTVFADPLSRALLERIECIAPSDAPVLVTGETGTGKELIAREVHARSRRAGRAFVAVNAGAFSESLIESELFGHEKGAFTGAIQTQIGWFEAAHGGTLFLDEIGELPHSLQVKLLRVLSTGEVTRLGSRAPIRVDVRLIAATNLDLLAAMRARRFREDLYYRLSVAGVALPALRERRGDVLPLARHFLERYAAQLGKPTLQLAPSALDWLERHPFPGNVRELENAIHHAVLVCRADRVEAGDLHGGGADASTGSAARGELLGERGATGSGALAPGKLRKELDSDEATVPALRPPSPPNELERAVAPAGADVATLALGQLEQALLQLLPLGLPDLHARIESTLLATTFDYAGNNQLEAARLLGLSRHVVRARLIEHGQLEGRARRRPSGSRPEAGSSVLQAPTANPLRSRNVLRVGYQKLGLLMLVKAYGALDIALDSRNVGIAWQEYSGGIQIVEALRAGELDVGVVGDCPAVYAQAERVPVVYVAAEPPSPCGAAVLVPQHSSARSMHDLRGKRVAVNRAAQAHYLLMLALEEAGLRRDDIDLCFEPPERALAAFQSGAIDAWAVWDPWLSSARLDLGARVLRDTTGLFDSSIYYLARRELAEGHPDLVRELCAQLRTAARWVQSDRGRVAHLAAPGLGFSPRALAASLDRELSAIGGMTATQLEAQQHIADQCLRLQLIPRSVSVADAQWPTALAG